MASRKRLESCGRLRRRPWQQQRMPRLDGVRCCFMSRRSVPGQLAGDGTGPLDEARTGPRTGVGRGEVWHHGDATVKRGATTSLLSWNDAPPVCSAASPAGRWHGSAAAVHSVSCGTSPHLRKECAMLDTIRAAAEGFARQAGRLVAGTRGPLDRTSIPRPRRSTSSPRPTGPPKRTLSKPFGKRSPTTTSTARRAAATVRRMARLTAGWSIRWTARSTTPTASRSTRSTWASWTRTASWSWA